MISDKHRDELVDYVKRNPPISLPAGLHHDMMLTPEQSQFVAHAIEAWAIVEQLRAEEGDSVEINHDNPDFGPPDQDCAITHMLIRLPHTNAEDY